jgi:hypothetical protein
MISALPHTAPPWTAAQGDATLWAMASEIAEGP